jgi:hypothetical protein
MGTQAAIVKYQGLECAEEKKVLYVAEILPAFNKLSENLIFVYGFKSSFSSFEELKSDCVSFLYESLHKWSPEKGTKAFSYYNVVAKNWLIVNCRQHKKLSNRHVSIDNPEGMTSSQQAAYEKHDFVPSPDEQMMKAQQKEQILKLLDEMRVKLTNENELLCLQAIETLFASIDHLDLLSKRAVLVYIREISGLDKKQMSKAMSSIRRHYRRMAGPNSNFDIF